MKRILIIEDELEMLRNLTTILRLEEFRPLPAENGRIGVDLAKKQKPDLILCDVMMPGLDGYGVIAALRADAETATIPVIFLTAKAEKLDICAGISLGVDDYITKPVAKADLLAIIRSRLERAYPPAAFADELRKYYGPTIHAFEAAEKNSPTADLQKELEELFNRQNQSLGKEATSIPATFLRVTVAL